MTCYTKSRLKSRGAYPGPVLPEWWTIRSDTGPDHGRSPHNSTSLKHKHQLYFQRNILSNKYFVHYDESNSKWSCFKSNPVFESSCVHYTPLVTPLVERQPCHSLNSLLWQHSPSGPIAVQVKWESDNEEMADRTKLDYMQLHLKRLDALHCWIIASHA